MVAECIHLGLAGRVLCGKVRTPLLGLARLHQLQAPLVHSLGAKRGTDALDIGIDAHLLPAAERDGAHGVVGGALPKRRAFQLVDQLRELAVCAARVVHLWRRRRLFVRCRVLFHARLERGHHGTHLVRDERDLRSRVLRGPFLLVIVAHEKVRVGLVAVGVEPLSLLVRAPLGPFLVLGPLPDRTELFAKLGVACLERLALLGLVVRDDPVRLRVLVVDPLFHDADLSALAMECHPCKRAAQEAQRFTLGEPCDVRCRWGFQRRLRAPLRSRERAPP